MHDLAEQLRSAAVAAAPNLPLGNGGGGGRRPRLGTAGAGGGRTAEAAPVVAPAEAVDLSNLPAVWQAVCGHLEATKNGSINLNLGSSSRLESLDLAAGEAVLAVPAHMAAYATDRVRLKIEESLAAVVAAGGEGGSRPPRVTFRPDEALSKAGRAEAGAAHKEGHQGVGGGHAAAQRVPIETERAVLDQLIIRKIIENLGGDVKSIELLETEGDGV